MGAGHGALAKADWVLGVVSLIARLVTRLLDRAPPSSGLPRRRTPPNSDGPSGTAWRRGLRVTSLSLKAEPGSRVRGGGPPSRRKELPSHEEPVVIRQRGEVWDVFDGSREHVGVAEGAWVAVVKGVVVPVHLAECQDLYCGLGERPRAGVTT